MDDMFVGITLGPNSFYDEGIEHVFDTLQETAGVNAVAVYTIQSMTPGCRPNGALADHGKPIPFGRLGDNITWFKVREEYYGGTMLRQAARPPQGAWADKDIFADLEKPAKERGVRVFSRILEGWRMPRPNFLKAHEIDMLGRLRDRPCYNHPDYINFWLSMIEDLFRGYPWLAGIYWGSENIGPIPSTLRGGNPACFCEHCRRSAREKGVDPERARLGFVEFHALVQSLRSGGARPSEGAFIEFLRLFMRWPEIFAWERLWNEAYNRLPRLMQGAMKAINPRLELGWHGDHGATGLNMFKRAGHDFREMVEFYDWVKPCVYHNCAGPRLHDNLTDLNRSLFSDLSMDQMAEFHYAIHGYNSAEEPSAANLASKDLDKARLSGNYVYNEMRRVVEAVQGRIPVYTGVGFGIPVWNQPAHEAPEMTYADCMKGFEAGADGILISREYDENPIPNLKAVGQAARDWKASRPNIKKENQVK